MESLICIEATLDAELQHNVTSVESTPGEQEGLSKPVQGAPAKRRSRACVGH